MPEENKELDDHLNDPLGKEEPEINPEEEGGEIENEVPKNPEEDRWNGKSREEVIKSFEEQEQKNSELQERLENKEESGNEKKEVKKENEDDDIPSDEEFAKMTPRQFAKWNFERMKKETGKIYDERSNNRIAVDNEIAEAKKAHPQIEEPAYRELVLSLIRTAEADKKELSLEDACKKVDEITGNTGKKKGKEIKEEEEKIRQKKENIQIEKKGAPPAGGKEVSEEGKRLQGVFAKKSSESPLGGLGV